MQHFSKNNRIFQNCREKVKNKDFYETIKNKQIHNKQRQRISR